MNLKLQISLFFYFMEAVISHRLDLNNTRRSGKVINGGNLVPCAFLPILTQLWADEEAILASPGFPTMYPHNSDCGWKFRINDPRVGFHVKCKSFKVGRQRQRCNHRRDRLVLDDGVSKRKLCGNKPGVEYVCDGNTLDLRFISTKRRSHSGFLCSVLAHRLHTNSTV